MFKSVSQEEKERFMRKAVELSKEGSSSGLGAPFGAVIVSKDGKVVAENANRVFIDNDPTAHAEICAIRKACKELKTIDLTGYHIYASCYPCEMCMAAIYWTRLEAIFYGVSDDDYRFSEIYNPSLGKLLTDDELKSSEEKSIYREWVGSFADEAKKIGEEFMMATTERVTGNPA